MSGGSMNYVSSRIENEALGTCLFPIMERLTGDFAKVLHEIEWAVSCDTSEEDAREAVVKFLDKWHIPHRAKDLTCPKCSECKHCRTLMSDWERTCNSEEANERYGHDNNMLQYDTAAGCAFYEKATKKDREERSKEEQKFRLLHPMSHW